MPHFDLTRFENAQRSAYATALQEIRAGKKRGHWIWFIFPQIAGLGFSDMSVHFAINSVEEAEAFLAHPVLGPGLREMTNAMIGNDSRDPALILGAVDAAKFRSSMTLFHLTAPHEPCFRLALEKFFGGQIDHETLRRVRLWQQTASAGGD